MLPFFPGEQLIHVATDDDFTDSGSKCTLIITNARIIKLPPKGAGFTPNSTYYLDNFFEVIELDDIADVEVKTGGFKLSGLLKLRLVDGSSVEFKSTGENMLALADKFNTARATAVPYLRFEDPEETLLFKSSGNRRKPSGAWNRIWRRTFERCNNELHAGARLCITNRRIIFYRIDILDHLDARSYNISFRMGPPQLLWIEIPIRNVVAASARKSFFGNGIRLRIGRIEPNQPLTPIAGYVPTKASVTLPALFAPPRASQVLSCNVCGQAQEFNQLPWTTYRQYSNEFAEVGVQGYACQACGTVVCEGCRKQHLKTSWWSGWEKATCPKCGMIFGPGQALLPSEKRALVAISPELTVWGDEEIEKNLAVGKEVDLPITDSEPEKTFNLITEALRRLVPKVVQG